MVGASSSAISASETRGRSALSLLFKISGGAIADTREASGRQQEGLKHSCVQVGHMIEKPRRSAMAVIQMIF